jgi:hypothetical protein
MRLVERNAVALLRELEAKVSRLQTRELITDVLNSLLSSRKEKIPLNQYQQAKTSSAIDSSKLMKSITAASPPPKESSFKGEPAQRHSLEERTQDLSLMTKKSSAYSPPRVTRRKRSPERTIRKIKGTDSKFFLLKSVKTYNNNSFRLSRPTVFAKCIHELRSSLSQPD